MTSGDALILATNNAHKVREIKTILGGRFLVIRTMAEAGLALDPEETGATFEENAVIKAPDAVRPAQFLQFRCGHQDRHTIGREGSEQVDDRRPPVTAHAGYRVIHDDQSRPSCDRLGESDQHALSIGQVTPLLARLIDYPGAIQGVMRASHRGFRHRPAY